MSILCMRGNRIMMNGAPDAGMGHHVRTPSSLANTYTMLYILFFLPFSPVAMSIVTATQPVLSVTELFATKRRQKEKKKRKEKKRKQRRTRNGRGKMESKRVLKLDDM